MSLLDDYLNPKKQGGADPAPHGNGERPGGPAGHTLDMPVAMLDVVLMDGRHAAYPYAILLRAQLQPDAGLVLEFSNDTVVIRGHALEGLYRAVIQHRASRIEINGDPRGFGQPASPQSPVVTGIEIVEGK